MTAKYLIRFDDICPQMNWLIWDKIEKSLDDQSIKPIVAVIPDNKDPQLWQDPPNPAFWDRVRAWKDKGWTIGLHGYQHVYETNKSGIIGINRRSEFAGLSYSAQKEKLEKALRVFENEKIEIDLWVAPAHSFDSTTLEILRQLGIKVISDGFFKRVVTYKDLVWIPQQIWRFEYKNDGVWTVCYHHSGWHKNSLQGFLSDTRKYRSKICCVRDIWDHQPIPSVAFSDHFWAFSWKWFLLIKNQIRKLIPKSAISAHGGRIGRAADSRNRSHGKS